MTTDDIGITAATIPDHPYLFLSQTAEAELRERCLHGDLCERYAELKAFIATRTADGVPAVPEFTDALADHEYNEQFNILDIVCDLAIASALVYRLEGDACHRALALRLFGDTLRRPTWNCVLWPEAVELSAAHTAAVVGILYDWLYPVLPRSERLLAESVLLQRALLPAAHLDDYRWSTAYRSNWSAVCVGSLGVATLALYRELCQQGRQPDAVLTEVVRRLFSYFAEYGVDGDWAEGPMYADYGLYHALLFFEALASVASEPCPALARFAETLACINFGHFFTGTFLPPDGLVNFGDCLRFVYDYLPVHYLAHRGDASYRWMVDALRAVSRAGRLYGHTEAHAFDLLWHGQHVMPTPPALPASRWFARTQWAVLRTGWEPEDAVVAIRIGEPHAAHCHWDHGSFILRAGGRTLIRDVGIIHYHVPEAGIAALPESHNIATFPELADDGDNGPAIIEAVELGSTRDLLRADLTALYRKRGLERYIREFIFDHAGTLTITDFVTLSQATTVCWRFHTDVPPELEQTQALLRDAARKILLTIARPPETPAAYTREVLTGLCAWDMMRLHADVHYTEDIAVLELRETLPAGEFMRRFAFVW